MHDSNHVAVIDFGSQYTQLIVRRVRELGFFAKLYAIEDFPDIGRPGAIILSGGPRSTSEPDAPDLDFAALKAFGVPVLGVCYGMQLLNIKFGGTVEASDRREYGPANLFPAECTGLYEGVSASSQVWMSHSDTVKILPEGAKVIATNQHGTPVSLQWNERFFGIQFHPEVTHSHEGLRILHNFLLHADNLLPFRIDDFKREIIDGIRDKVGRQTNRLRCFRRRGQHGARRAAARSRRQRARDFRRSRTDAQGRGRGSPQQLPPHGRAHRDGRLRASVS